MPNFWMIEVELNEYDGSFRVTSFDGESDLEVSNANDRRVWLDAMAHLLSCGWEPYACMHVPGSEYPSRHYFRKRVES